MKRVTITKKDNQPNLVRQSGIIIDKRKDTDESAVLLDDGKYVWIKNKNLKS